MIGLWVRGEHGLSLAARNESETFRTLVLDPGLDGGMENLSFQRDSIYVTPKDSTASYTLLRVVRKNSRRVHVASSLSVERRVSPNVVWPLFFCSLWRSLLARSRDARYTTRHKLVVLVIFHPFSLHMGGLFFFTNAFRENLSIPEEISLQALAPSNRNCCQRCWLVLGVTLRYASLGHRHM